MRFGDQIITEPIKERVDLALNVQDLTPSYIHHLGSAFLAARAALTTLDCTKSQLGGAAILTPQIDRDLREELIRQCESQTQLPVTEGSFGVNFIEHKAQVWLRNCLYAFVGTRLWQEIISPYFNHVHFGSILRDKRFEEVFVYDVETDKQSLFGLETESVLYSRRVSSLMSRLGIDSESRVFDLHLSIAAYIRETHGLSVYNKGEEVEWRKLYQKYWMMNEHRLITDSLREFMRDRTLVHIDVDLPAAWDSAALQGSFVGEWWRDNSDNNPLIKLFMGQVLRQYDSYVFAGQRHEGAETMAEAVEYVLSRIINRYTFFAAVKNEYLEEV